MTNDRADAVATNMDSLMMVAIPPLLEAMSAAWGWPILISAVGINGSLIAMRYAGPACEPDILAETIFDDILALPINVMAIGPDGDAYRCLIELDGSTARKRFH